MHFTDKTHAQICGFTDLEDEQTASLAVVVRIQRFVATGPVIRNWAVDHKPESCIRKFARDLTVCLGFGQKFTGFAPGINGPAVKSIEIMSNEQIHFVSADHFKIHIDLRSGFRGPGTDLEAVISVFINPAAVIQAHLESRWNPKQIAPSIHLHKDPLTRFGGEIELAGADREQHIEIGITLCDM